MGLTRKALKAMGLTEEQVDSIIEAHTEVVDALKEEAGRYKADAEKLPSVEAELETAKQTIADGNKDSWQVKYEAIKEDFEAYKNAENAKKTKADKENAYRAILRDVGISDKRIDAIMRVTDLTEKELGEDGSFTDAETLKESVKTEWADFITPVGTPAPRIDTGGNLNGGAAMTKADILNIKNRDERKAAIAANLSLFEKGE